MARKKKEQPAEEIETGSVAVEEAPEPEEVEEVRPRRAARKARSAEDIADRIAEGISEGLRRNAEEVERRAPKPRIKPGSSKFDPKRPGRSHNGPRLKGFYYDNGVLINNHEDQLFDDEINMLNSITTSGRYINRMVEVIVSDEAGTKSVFIRYQDKTIDQRMANKSAWRDFRDLLTQITNDQKKVVLATR